MPFSISKHTRVGFVAAFITFAVVGTSVGAAAYQAERARDIERDLNVLMTHYTVLQDQVNLLASANDATLSMVGPQNKTADTSLTAVVSRAAPAVVSIVVSKDVPKVVVEYDSDSFFGFRVPTYRQVGTEMREVGAGSGFIIHPSGYIMTNRHVAADDDAEYTVLLSTGVQKTARVLYRDPYNDLAIMKIEGSGLPTLPLGDSSSLKQGQGVIAIGNALGEYSNSVSTGIVSGLNRSVEAFDEDGRIEKLEGVIQTDAAINRGNSGGPLLDSSGKVIGVNVAVVSGGNSIAFAIPIEKAATLIGKMREGSKQ